MLKRSMIRCASILVFGLFAIAPALAQECPRPASATKASEPSEIRNLEGTLVFHDSIRRWFELKLDRPQCGQASIELMRQDYGWIPLQVLRGCRVRSSGIIDFSFTNYLSLDTYQDVDEIEAVGPCQRQMPFPDYSTAKPDPAIRKYRVEMFVDYRPGDHPIIFHIWSGKKELRPWQAYASYMLTGAFVLYGFCGEGFGADTVFGTPQAHPSLPGAAEGSVVFDPEDAAASGHRKLHLGYTCVRY
jgi:hypothetical protein